MHQRKLHLLALDENDLLASRLKDVLSLWVRGNSLQCGSVGCVWKRHNCSIFPASLHLSFLCTEKPCLKGNMGLAIKQGFVCLSITWKWFLRLKEGAISLPLHPSSPTRYFQLKTIERERERMTDLLCFFSFLISEILNIRQLLAGLTPPRKAYADELVSASVNPAYVSVRKPLRGMKMPPYMDLWLYIEL